MDQARRSPQSAIVYLEILSSNSNFLNGEPPKSWTKLLKELWKIASKKAWKCKTEEAIDLVNSIYQAQSEFQAASKSVSERTSSGQHSARRSIYGPILEGVFHACGIHAAIAH